MGDEMWEDFCRSQVLLMKGLLNGLQYAKMIEKAKNTALPSSIV